jgi:hypothetical protein
MKRRGARKEKPEERNEGRGVRYEKLEAAAFRWSLR